MIQKLHVTKVNSRSTKKDGTPLVNKYNKPYFLVSIQATEHGQNWITGFMNLAPQWEGQEVALDITEEMYNNQKQLRFAVPKKEEQTSSELKSMVLDVQLRLGRLTAMISALHDKEFKGKTSAGTPIPFPMPEDEKFLNQVKPKSDGTFEQSKGATTGGVLTSEDEEAFNNMGF